MELTSNLLPDSRNYDFKIRQSVAHLPFQWFFTWLSGCPDREHHVLFHRTPLCHVIDSIGGGVLCLAIGAFAIYNAPVSISIFLAPFAILTASGRFRKCYVTIEHQIVHCQLFNIKSRYLRQTCNQIVGELIATFLWVPGPEAFQITHAKMHHKNANLGFPFDPDASPLYRLGFVPGKEETQYWILLVRTLCNPSFYFREARNRIWFSLVVSRNRRALLSWFLVVSLLGPLPLVHGWWAFLLAYLIAVFLFFQAASLLQMLGEHHWGCHLDKEGNLRNAIISQGRFLLDEYPKKVEPLGHYLKFWIRLFCYHLPSRLFVLSGNVQHHDWHHRCPGSADWTRSSVARMNCIDAIASGNENDPIFTHTWSLGESIGRSFREMARAPSFPASWSFLLAA